MMNGRIKYLNPAIYAFKYLNCLRSGKIINQKYKKLFRAMGT